MPAPVSLTLCHSPNACAILLHSQRLLPLLLPLELLQPSRLAQTIILALQQSSSVRALLVVHFSHFHHLQLRSSLAVELLAEQIRVLHVAVAHVLLLHIVTELRDRFQVLLVVREAYALVHGSEHVTIMFRRVSRRSRHRHY